MSNRSKRISLDIPDDLYRRLEALAIAERRDIKPQLLLIVERACKQHEGRKRADETRKVINRLFK